MANNGKLDSSILLDKVGEKVRAELDKERTAVAKPILAGLHRWITTTHWMWLVAAIICTLPVHFLETVFMHLLNYLFPGLGLSIDLFLLHFNEWLFYGLPIFLSTELLRRVFWETRRRLSVYFPALGDRVRTEEVEKIEAELVLEIFKEAVATGVLDVDGEDLAKFLAGSEKTLGDQGEPEKK